MGVAGKQDRNDNYHCMSLHRLFIESALEGRKKYFAAEKTAKEFIMTYGVICDTYGFTSEQTGTVRLVKNPPAEYHGNGNNTHFYDVQHWDTLEKARDNFYQVQEAYTRNNASGVQFIDET